MNKYWSNIDIHDNVMLDFGKKWNDKSPIITNLKKLPKEIAQKYIDSNKWVEFANINMIINISKYYNVDFKKVIEDKIKISESKNTLESFNDYDKIDISANDFIDFCDTYLDVQDKNMKYYDQNIAKNFQFVIKNLYQFKTKKIDKIKVNNLISKIVGLGMDNYKYDNFAKYIFDDYGEKIDISKLDNLIWKDKLVDIFVDKIISWLKGWKISLYRYYDKSGDVYISSYMRQFIPDEFDINFNFDFICSFWNKLSQKLWSDRFETMADFISIQEWTFKEKTEKIQVLQSLTISKPINQILEYILKDDSSISPNNLSMLWELINNHKQSLLKKTEQSPHLQYIINYKHWFRLFEYIYNKTKNKSKISLYADQINNTKKENINFNLSNPSFMMGLAKTAEKEFGNKELITDEDIAKIISKYNENINKYLQKWKEALAEKNKTKIMVLWASKNEDHGIYALSDQKDKIIKCYQDLYWNDNVEDLEEWKKNKNISEDDLEQKSLIQNFIDKTSDANYNYKIIIWWHGNTTTYGNKLQWHINHSNIATDIYQEDIEKLLNNAKNKNVKLSITSCYSGYDEDWHNNKIINNIELDAWYHSSSVENIWVFLEAFEKKDKDWKYVADYDWNGVVNENEARIYQMLNYNYSLLPTRFETRDGEIIEIANNKSLKQNITANNS